MDKFELDANMRNTVPGSFAPANNGIVLPIEDSLPLKTLDNPQETIELVKRNRHNAKITNPDPFASLDKSNKFLSVLPDFDQIEQELDEIHEKTHVKRIIDHTLAEIWKLISDSLLGILDDILKGKVDSSTFTKDNRLFSIAILFITCAVLISFFE